MTQVGARVVAISHSKDGKLFIFGEGEYEGDKIPDENAAGMAADLREAGLPNPAIKLDSGEYVYGAECWWGNLAKAKEKFGHMEWVTVSIADARKKAQSED